MKLLGKKIYRIGLKPYKNGMGQHDRGDDGDTSTGGNSGCCVHPETQISMADGTTRAAKDILIGDKLQTQAGIGTVEVITNPELGLRQLFSYGRGSYFITGDHPIHTSEGWKSLSPKYSKLDYNTDCKPLKLGDVLTLINGDSYKLEKIEGESNNPNLVLYDFHMDGNEDANHTYFANGLLVHNGGGGGGGGGGGCSGGYANDINPSAYYGSHEGSADSGTEDYSGLDNDTTMGWGGGDTGEGEAPNASVDTDPTTPGAQNDLQGGDDSGPAPAQGWGGGDTGEGGSRPGSADDTMGWGGGDTGQGSAPPEGVKPVGTGEETEFGGDDPNDEYANDADPGSYYGSHEGSLDADTEDYGGEDLAPGGGAMGVGDGEAPTTTEGQADHENYVMQLKDMWDDPDQRKKLTPNELQQLRDSKYISGEGAETSMQGEPGDTKSYKYDTSKIQQDYNAKQAALYDPKGLYPDKDYWSELSDKDKTDYANKEKKAISMARHYKNYLDTGGDPSLSAKDFSKKYNEEKRAGFWRKAQAWAKKFPGKAVRALPKFIAGMILGGPLVGMIGSMTDLIDFGKKINKDTDPTIVDHYNDIMDAIQDSVDEGVDEAFPNLDAPTHEEVIGNIKDGTNDENTTPPTSPGTGGGNQGGGNNGNTLLDKIGEDDPLLGDEEPGDGEPGTGTPGAGEPGAGTPEGGTMPPKTSDEMYDEYMQKLRAQAFGESPSLSEAAMRREREEGLKERLAVMGMGRGQPSASGLRQYDRAKGTADRELAAGAAEVSLKEQQAMMGEYGKQLSDQKERDRRERASQASGDLAKDLKHMDIEEKKREGWTRAGLSLLKGAWSRYGNKVEDWVKAGWNKLTAEEAVNEISLDPDYFWESQAVNLDDASSYKPNKDQWYVENMPSPDSNGGISIDLDPEVESQGDWEITPGGEWTWVWNWQWSPTSSTPETAGALVGGEWVDMFVQNQVGQLIPNSSELGDSFFNGLFPDMTVFPTVDDDDDDDDFDINNPWTWVGAEGGSVEGPGTETSDDIPALLSDGEFVIKASAVKGLGRSKGAKTDEEARDKGIELLYELQNKYGDLEEYSDGGAAFGDIIAERRLLDRNRVRGGRNV